MKFLPNHAWMIDVSKLETNLRAIICTFTLQIEVIQPECCDNPILNGDFGRNVLFMSPEVFLNMQEATRVSGEQRTVLFV